MNSENLSVPHMEVIIDGEVKLRRIDYETRGLNEIEMIDSPDLQRLDSIPKPVPVLYDGEELVEVLSGPPIIRRGLDW